MSRREGGWGSDEKKLNNFERERLNARIAKLGTYLSSVGDYEIHVDLPKAIKVLKDISDESKKPEFSIQRWPGGKYVTVDNIVYKRPIDFIEAMEELIEPGLANRPPRGKWIELVTDDDLEPQTSRAVPQHQAPPDPVVKGSERLRVIGPSPEQQEILRLRNTLHHLGVLDVVIANQASTVYTINILTILTRVLQAFLDYKKHDDNKSSPNATSVKPFFKDRRIVVSETADRASSEKTWHVVGKTVALRIGEAFGRTLRFNQYTRHMTVDENKLVERATEFQKVLEKKEKFYYSIRQLQTRFGLNLEAVKNASHQHERFDWEYATRALPGLLAVLEVYEHEFTEQSESLKHFLMGYVVTFSPYQQSDTKMRKHDTPGHIALGRDLEDARLHVQLFLEGLLQSHGIERGSK